MVVSQKFQVRIVRCDHAKRLLIVHFQQDSLCNCASELRFCSGSKLVDEEQGALVAMLKNLLHVDEVRAVCREVVFQRLLIADVDEHIMEYAAFRVDLDRNRQTALQHVLN